VTCMALSEKGNFLATGSKDTTVIIWEVDAYRSETYVTEKPKYILYGHDEEVTCVAISEDLDIVVSGSKDGSCMIHTLRKADYITSCYPPGHNPNEDGNCELLDIVWVGISRDGKIISYSVTDLRINLFSVNGRHLQTVESKERLYAFCLSQDGQYLVTGGSKKKVIIRKVHDLKVVHQFKPVDASIRSLALANEQQLIVGLQNGQLLIYAIGTCFLHLYEEGVKDSLLF